MWLRHFVRLRWRGLDPSIRLKRYALALCYVFNVHTLLLMVVACFAVYLCDLYNFKYNMDFTLVATGTTFPLVFTISQAFARREKATSLIANLKASVVATFYMHRDWDQSEGYPGVLGNNTTCWAKSVKVLLQEFLLNLKCFLTCTEEFESLAEMRLGSRRRQAIKLMLNDTALSLSGGSEASFHGISHSTGAKDPAHSFLMKCYKNLSQLSVMNEQLTRKAGYSKGGEGGLSRTNQYLRYIISNLEELRMIRDYRTPAMMRHACGVLLHVFAVVLAPYFTHFCDSWISYGYDKDRCPAGYSASIVYVTIVMLLYHIQSDIEQPFDNAGLDDIFFELVEEMDDVVDCCPPLWDRTTHGRGAPVQLGGSSPNGPEGASPKNGFRSEMPTRQPTSEDLGMYLASSVQLSLQPPGARWGLRGPDGASPGRGGGAVDGLRAAAGFPALGVPRRTLEGEGAGGDAEEQQLLLRAGSTTPLL